MSIFTNAAYSLHIPNVTKTYKPSLKKQCFHVHLHEYAMSDQSFHAPTTTTLQTKRLDTPNLDILTILDFSTVAAKRLIVNLQTSNVKKNIYNHRHIMQLLDHFSSQNIFRVYHCLHAKHTSYKR